MASFSRYALVVCATSEQTHAPGIWQPAITTQENQTLECQNNHKASWVTASIPMRASPMPASGRTRFNPYPKINPESKMSKNSFHPDNRVNQSPRTRLRNIVAVISTPDVSPWVRSV